MYFKKLVSRLLVFVAAIVVIEAAVIFIIVSSPRSDLGIWLSDHDPLFNLLKSSAISPPERVLVPPTRTGSSANNLKVTRVPGKHFVVVPEGHPVFAKPDLDSKLLGKTERKYKLEVLEEKDSWYRLEFTFGEGWIHPSVNARFLATGAPLPLGRSTSARKDSRGKMAAEIKVEEDTGRRPDAIYFEYAGERNRPYFFNDLFEEDHSIELASPAPWVNPGRLQEAMKFLGSNVQSKRVDEFIMRYTDARWAEDAEPVIKKFKESYQGLFKSLAVRSGKNQSAYIFLFPSLNAFKSFYPDAHSGVSLRTTGHFENGIIALNPDIGPLSNRRGTLVHELAHHFNNSMLQINSVSTVNWLDEGMASYFGNCFIDGKGKLHLNRIKGDDSAATWSGGTGYQYNVSPKVRIMMLQRELRSGQKVRIKSLMTLDQESFYNSKLVTNYTSSWMLVHYLFNGKGGQYRQKFLSYIARLRNEEVSPEQFADILGVSLDRLENELRAYILSK